MYHVLRNWQHPTDENKVCVEVWCDVINEVFHYDASKSESKTFT